MSRAHSQHNLYRQRLKTETEERQKENQYELVATVARLQARLQRCPRFSEVAQEIGKSVTTAARRIYGCIHNGLLGRDENHHRETTFVTERGLTLLEARGNANNLFWGS